MMIYLFEFLIMVASGLAISIMLLMALGLPWPQMLIPGAIALVIGFWLHNRLR